MRKKIIINGIETEVILPKGFKPEDLPDNITTRGNKTVNVGIKDYQKNEILLHISYGETVNGFVQDAVKTKLDVLRGKEE